MGYLQLDLGDAAAALESFTLASNRCSKCYSAQYGYGVAASRTQSWAQAKSAFEGILSRENFRADALYQLALVHKNGFKDNNKAASLLQDIVSDADGRFKEANSVKRVANITLRRIKSSDRTGAQPMEAVTPHGDEMPARNSSPADEPADYGPDDATSK
jgi:hypothetical protein